MLKAQLPPSAGPALPRATQCTCSLNKPKGEHGAGLTALGFVKMASVPATTFLPHLLWGFSEMQVQKRRSPTVQEWMAYGKNVHGTCSFTLQAVLPPQSEAQPSTKSCPVQVTFLQSYGAKLQTLPSAPPSCRPLQEVQGHELTPTH